MQSKGAPADAGSGAETTGAVIRTVVGLVVIFGLIVGILTAVHYSTPPRLLATFGPVYFLWVLTAVTGEVLYRKGVPWVRRLRSQNDDQALRVGFTLASCAMGAFVGAGSSLLAARWHLSVPGTFGSPGGWCGAALGMALSTACTTLFATKPYEAPEDWLLWDLEPPPRDAPR